MANLWSIDLSEEATSKARATITDVIKQAQNGVTVFSPQGILANILFDLNLTPISED